MNNDSFPNIEILSLELTNTIGTKTISLKKIFLEMNLFESLYDHFLKGEISLLDTYDLQVNFPLIGNETLEMKLTDRSRNADGKENFKNLTFKIYKLDDLGLYRGITNKKVITLYFTSQEAITNEQTKISKKLTGTAETILTTIITNNLNSTKNFTSETSDATSLDIFANFSRPSKLINLISKKSKSVSYSDYTFYEDLDGFNFKTFSWLMSQAIKQEFTYSLNSDSLASSHNVKMLQWDSNFDVLADTHLGLFGTTFYTPHATDYSYIKTSDQFKDKFSEIVGLGAHLIYDANLSTSHARIDTNHLDPDIIANRNVSLKTLQRYKLNAKINGDLDRRIGDIIKINFPVFDSKSYSNKNFNGKFLIVKIKHIIKNTGKFEQNLLLVKNAFFGNDQMSSVTTLNNI